MINSCRTWLIFPIWNISNLALDGIYFPTLSVKISIHNIVGGIWHHCYCCSTPTKCSVHSRYRHTCVFAFLMQLQYLDFYKSVYSKEWDPSTFCKSLIRISTKDVILPKNINDCLLIHLQGYLVHGNYNIMDSHKRECYFPLEKW